MLVDRRSRRPWCVGRCERQPRPRGGGARPGDDRGRERRRRMVERDIAPRGMLPGRSSPAFVGGGASQQMTRRTALVGCPPDYCESSGSLSVQRWIPRSEQVVGSIPTSGSNRPEPLGSSGFRPLSFLTQTEPLCRALGELTHTGGSCSRTVALDGARCRTISTRSSPRGCANGPRTGDDRNAGPRYCWVTSGLSTVPALGVDRRSARCTASSRIVSRPMRQRGGIVRCDEGGSLVLRGEPASPALVARDRRASWSCYRVSGIMFRMTSVPPAR